MNRRIFLGGGLVALSGCTRLTPPIGDFEAIPADETKRSSFAPRRTAPPRDPYAATVDNGFAIPAVPPDAIPARFRSQEVADPFGEIPGTIVVDPGSRFLYLVAENGRALRYGVGVGREGFGWSGEAVVQYKRSWPRWKVPAEMIAREPQLAKWSVANGGMPGGLDNPLGARALYLFQNGEDTLYRLHGTNEPRSIGKAVSSGCIRLVNQDVIDLAARVPNGSRVVVLSATG